MAGIGVSISQRPMNIGGRSWFGAADRLRGFRWNRRVRTPTGPEISRRLEMTIEARLCAKTSTDVAKSTRRPGSIGVASRRIFDLLDEIEADFLERDLRHALKAKALAARLPIQIVTLRLLEDGPKIEDPTVGATERRRVALHRAWSSGAERLLRGLQRADARRTPQRDAVPRPRPCPVGTRPLGRRLQRSPPAFRARLPHAERLRIDLHRNGRPAAQSRPAPPIDRCPPGASASNSGSTPADRHIATASSFPVPASQREPNSLQRVRNSLFCLAGNSAISICRYARFPASTRRILPQSAKFPCIFPANREFQRPVRARLRPPPQILVFIDEFRFVTVAASSAGLSRGCAAHHPGP